MNQKRDNIIVVGLCLKKKITASELLVEQKSVLDCCRILRIFSHKKEVNKKIKKKKSFLQSTFLLNCKEGNKKILSTIINKCRNLVVGVSFTILFPNNWDLVDSASSHMLVSRTKPCMPQNHCNAGICAWLITSDVICRKNFADLPHIGYLGETPS